MTELLVCAPLRLEARAVRAGLGTAEVLRTGAGPRRSRRSATLLRSALAQRPNGGLAVVGVCGGVSPDLRPGDIVVASEVRGPDGIMPCPAAPLLAGQLRRRGLDRVFLGPIASTPHLAVGARRTRLAAQGVLAADTESTWLLDGAGAHPRVVVRVVADSVSNPLARPSTVRNGLSALRRLREVADALDEWSDALGPRTVRLASPQSFCAGVDRAIDTVQGALDRYGAPVYVHKQIVHNAHVVHELERAGAVFVEDVEEVPPGATVVFSAHGVAPAVHTAAAGRSLQVIDATCPLVAKVHAEARRFASQGHTVLLIGHAGHEEPEGTLGEAPDRMILVGSVDEARSVEVPDPTRVSYLMQTTLSVEEANEVVEVLRSRFPAIVGPSSEDICYATTNRQQAVRAVAVEADLVLVVGSANSSNSQRLVETARRVGTPAHLVDSAADVRPEWLVGVRTVGVTAGASTPGNLVDELVDALGGLGEVNVQHRQVTTETLEFTLPKEVTGP